MSSIIGSSPSLEIYIKPLLAPLAPTRQCRNTQTLLLGPQSSHGSVQKIDFNTKSHRSCT
ncbi:hypothetical protein KFK09_003584 [Dendrobium nobile]|uniref:Uncharacterized protein n=1 Tax=Dendrobium nobile TaxID=94219 RepID=A0A8T3C1P7_DENNO|nr:hypothetical protein KFK09_003584 [Dendrobium nobile]